MGTEPHWHSEQEAQRINILGLGAFDSARIVEMKWLAISESQVRVPAEMFAVTDSFYVTSGTDPPSWEPAFRLIPAISESQVRVPAKMFAVADSLYYSWTTYSLDASRSTIETLPFINRSRNTALSTGGVSYKIQEPPQHAKTFNVLFCDGHVSPVRILDLFDVRKTAVNWNNDHEPHPETW